jgi:hypothetical protein
MGKGKPKATTESPAGNRFSNLGMAALPGTKVMAENGCRQE